MPKYRRPGSTPPSQGGSKADIENLMKQAQRMSEEAERVSAELALVTFRASSGGGAVSVEATGDRKVTKVEIDPELLNPDDCEMLCDMILAATNEALRLADEESQLRMGAVSSRLGLPGM